MPNTRNHRERLHLGASFFRKMKRLQRDVTKPGGQARFPECHYERVDKSRERTRDAHKSVMNACMLFFHVYLYILYMCVCVIINAHS